MKAVTWDEFEGMFVLVVTEDDLQSCKDADWPTVRWNDEKGQYETLDLDGEWTVILETK